jgi:CspA family cold shock protein
MSTGKLKWYNGAKGFGFIVPDDGGNDVFVHVTAFKEANITKIDQGQALEYEVKEHNGKPVASGLKLLETPGDDESAGASNEASADTETPAQ